MARVIPTGGSDQTAFFVARNAAADDALARLYMTLLARREERERLYQQQKELAGIQHGYGMERLQYQYGPPVDAANTPNPFGGTGAASNPLVKPAPAVAAPAALPPRPGDAPASYLPSRFGNPPSASGVGGTVERPYVGPNPNAFTKTSDASDGEKALKRTMLLSANSQPQPGDSEQPNIVLGTSGSTDFSAQARNPTLPGQRGRNNVEPGTLKLPPRRQTRGEATFMPIHPQWVKAMDDAEKKYQIPQGTLMTLYGYENGGGWDMGRNGRSSANGLFQFTDALREQHGIRPEDRNNPAVMIEAAARNLRHNANSYKKLSGRELGTDPKTVPYWVALHQFGSGDGPRIVHAALSDSGHMPATDVMLKVKGRDNYSVLVNNRIPGYAQVNDLIKGIANKALPWFDRSIQLRGNSDQPQTAQPGADGQPPRPPGSVPSGRIHNEEILGGVNPRLVAAVKGGAELALPDGYTVRAVSGVRHGNNQSYHRNGSAADFQIYKPDGTPIPHKGEDTTGLYTHLARGVRTWALENDPEMAKRIGYGGAFGTKIGGGGVPDLMHYDTGGSRGRMRPQVQFARLPPLEAHERRQPPASAAASTAQPQPPPTAAKPAVAAAPPQYPPLKPTEASGRSGKGVSTFGAPVSAPIATAQGFGDFASVAPIAKATLPAKTDDRPPDVVPPTTIPLPRGRPADAPSVPIPQADVRLPQARPDLLGTAIPDAEVKLPQGRPVGADYPPVEDGWGAKPTTFPPPVKPPHVSTPPDMWRTEPVKPLTADAFIEGGTPAVPGLDNPFGANTPNTMVAPDTPEHINIEPAAAPPTPPEVPPEVDINTRPEMSQNLDEFQSAGGGQATPEQQATAPRPYQMPQFSANPNPPAPPTVDAQSGFASIRGAAEDATRPPPATIPAPVQGGTWQTIDQMRAQPNQPQLPPSNTIPTTQQVAEAIFSGRAANEWPMQPPPGAEWPKPIMPDYSGGGNTWAPPIPDVKGVWNSVSGALSSKAAESDARNAEREKAIKDWVSGKASSVKQAFDDWRYGPKKVTTTKIGMPTAPQAGNTNAPSRLSTGPAATGLPEVKQPPLTLTPKNGAAAIPFTANTGLPAAPPLSNPSGAKTIPGGATAAPPMSNRVPDPSSPTGFKYLTPAEMEEANKSQAVEEPVEQ